MPPPQVPCTPAKCSWDTAPSIYSPAQSRNQAWTFKQDASNDPERTKREETQTSIHLFHILLLGTDQVPDTAENEVPAPWSLQSNGEDS